ncbi:MAG: ABC transporter permease [Chthoniobacterales bacterium]
MSAAAPPTHRAFSPRRVWAIASNTFTELTRLKVFYILLIFAFAMIASSVVMARLTFQQEFQALQDISLGVMSMVASLLAILATARLLAQDLEDRTVYTILAKPVPRSEYLAGKFVGVVLLLTVSIAVMAALFFVVLFFREHAALAETARQMSGQPVPQIAEALRAIEHASFNANLFAAIAIIFVKAALLAALTLFISTFATSNIFTVAVAIFVYFIGHLQATAREFWLQEQGGGWLSHLFLAFVALVFPDLQQFNLADEITGVVIPLALLLKTIGLAGFYVLLYLLLSIAVFNSREL